MISIIIVNHDGGEVLLRTLGELEALAARSPQPPWQQLLLVDNASTDGSREQVRSRFPAVDVLALERNHGFGAAMNRGAAAARGDRLLLLNSDAWPLPGAVERLDAALDADPRLALVAPMLRYPDGRRQFHWAPSTGVAGEAVQKLRNHFEGTAWVHRVRPPLLHRWYTAAFLLVRREAFEQVGGFDESFLLYFEDADLCLRLREAGWRLGDVLAAEAIHVKGGSQPARDALGSVEYRRSQLLYYAKHRPAWENRYLRRRLRRRLCEISDPARRAAWEALLRT